MTAIECYHNGRKLTTAGGEDVDLLLAILRWRQGDSGQDQADIEICGQRGDDHLVWKDVPLKQGDEILLRLVDVGDPDMDRPQGIFRIC
jgi:hypothetical protein